jgi:hypothetical protein
MYTIETLKAINGSYDYEHRIIQSDVDKANMYVDIIQKSRTAHQIQVGDIVELTTKHGSYYKNAHIEKYDVEDDEWSVCEQPTTPFISDYKNNIRCSTSGGAWCSVPNNLKIIGKRLKVFKDWGQCGACANGAVSFETEVNVWEYKQDEPLYGEYTTKDWRRHYISYSVDEYGNPKDGSLYRY